ncbi:hypothetical protein NPIL_644871 [Nephila pilipes]|uniref:Uncharacterized protein n=1 Tax=Nephila pilipes TaxID=299642 RepID=A0A8X6TDC0_NEPPI|nr:hypothetical protein NPIL_644871 [Nephila pilipes]
MLRIISVKSKIMLSHTVQEMEDQTSYKDSSKLQIVHPLERSEEHCKDSPADSAAYQACTSGVYISQKRELDLRVRNSVEGAQWGARYLTQQTGKELCFRKPHHARKSTVNIQYHLGQSSQF